MVVSLCSTTSASDLTFFAAYKMMERMARVRAREVARANDPSRSEWHTIRGARIESIIPLGNCCIVYEGCNRPPRDGRLYQLGREARQNQNCGDVKIFPNSRHWDNHMCSPIGENLMMYKFIIVINVIEWEIFELAGAQLFGLSGPTWAQGYGRRGGLPADVQHRVLMELWTVRLVTWFCEGSLHT